MMKHLLTFNLFLVGLALLGCQTGDKKKKDGKEAAFMRFHLETSSDGTKHNAPVPIYRADPVLVNVQRNAALDEGFMKKVEVVDVDPHGGYGIKVIFTDEGKQRLDYLTTPNRGLRLAVHARWTESRWLAAPVITKRITDGVFIFTPDASREECERIVRGLENVIKKLGKPYTII